MGKLRRCEPLTLTSAHSVPRCHGLFTASSRRGRPTRRPVSQQQEEVGLTINPSLQSLVWEDRKHCRRFPSAPPKRGCGAKRFVRNALFACRGAPSDLPHQAAAPSPPVRTMRTWELRGYVLCPKRSHTPLAASQKPVFKIQESMGGTAKGTRAFQTLQNFLL